MWPLTYEKVFHIFCSTAYAVNWFLHGIYIRICESFFVRLPRGMLRSPEALRSLKPAGEGGEVNEKTPGHDESHENLHATENGTVEHGGGPEDEMKSGAEEQAEPKKNAPPEEDRVMVNGHGEEEDGRVLVNGHGEEEAAVSGDASE